MKGFVVQARRREVIEDKGRMVPALEPATDFGVMIFFTNKLHAEEWQKTNINHAEVESRVLPGIAIPKDLVSNEYTFGTAH